MKKQAHIVSYYYIIFLFLLKQRFSRSKNRRELLFFSFYRALSARIHIL